MGSHLPKLPLFPYTTLFRSANRRVVQFPRYKRVHSNAVQRVAENKNIPQLCKVKRLDSEMIACTKQRSEEHTSELQSRQYLVCRLLLEKKKQNHQYLAESTR